MKREYLISAGVIILFIFFISCQKLSINNLKANYHFKKANKLYSDQNYKKAIEEYEETMKYAPNLASAHFYLGSCYQLLFKPGIESEDNKKKAEKAIEHFNRVLELDPNNKDVFYNLGDIYDRLRNFEQAEKYYKKILELDPKNSNNYYVVAEFYNKYDKDDQAVKMYLKRIELDPSNPEGYSYLASFYSNKINVLTDLEKAKDYMRKSIEIHEKRVALDPNNAEAFYSLGVTCWAMSYRVMPNEINEERRAIIEKGIKALEKSIELAPDYPDPNAWAGLLYRELAKVDIKNEKKYKQIAEDYLRKHNEVRERKLEKEKLLEQMRAVTR
ncbi:MAG: tetratricopeptide repeat protein [Acidobacteriota bacterium]